MTTLYDIEIQQGAKFLLNVQARNKADNSILSLVGYSGKLQIKSAPGGTLLMEASTANGYITINGPSGIVSINVPATVTAPMTWNTGVYDLEVFTGAPDTIRLLEGYAALSLEVTT